MMLCMLFFSCSIAQPADLSIAIKDSYLNNVVASYRETVTVQMSCTTKHSDVTLMKYFLCKAEQKKDTVCRCVGSAVAGKTPQAIEYDINPADWGSGQYYGAVHLYTKEDSVRYAWRTDTFPDRFVTVDFKP